MYSNYSIYVTGHSLGAALAILCAADLVVVGKLPVAGVYTFGGPRVGNLAFSQWYNQNIAPEVFRFTHRHDIVPHVVCVRTAQPGCLYSAVHTRMLGLA